MRGWWPRSPMAPAGSITCRNKGCTPCRRTWSASGARRRSGSGCWPRTPPRSPPEAPTKRRANELTAADVVRGRLLSRARVQRLVGRFRDLVAQRSHSLREGREGRAAARRRRADLRAHGRRHRTRLGRGDRVATADPARLSVAPRRRPHRRHRGGDPLPLAGPRPDPRGERAPGLGATRPGRPGMARTKPGRLAVTAAALPGRDQEGGSDMTAGTKEDPWVLKTPPGTSGYTMYKDEQADPPTLVCQVGSTRLKYRLRAVEDLHAWLKAQADWVPL